MDIDPTDPMLLAADCHDGYLPSVAKCFYNEFDPNVHPINKSGIVPPHLKLYRADNDGTEQTRRKQLAMLLGKRHDIRLSPVESSTNSSGFVSMATGIDSRVPIQLSPATGAIRKAVPGQSFNQVNSKALVSSKEKKTPTPPPIEVARQEKPISLADLLKKIDRISAQYDGIVQTISYIMYSVTRPMYYIPYHALPPPRKFRVVFNASSPTSTGVSLNAIQFPGEHLQDALCKQVTKFGLYRIAMTADVKKMFR